MGVLFAVAALAAVFIMLIFIGVSGTTSTRYPDGRCYMCRRGVASPGETCNKCGEEQPC